MEKREVYEHLARIYLDASLKYKKKKKITLPFVFLGFLIILAASVGIKFLFLSKRDLSFPHNISLLLNNEPIKINFNFDPAKKEIYSLSLNDLNLKNYKLLTFRVRKSDYLDKIHMRIELINNFKEVSSVYLQDIPYHWQEFKIPFSDFKNINKSSGIKQLQFVIEEWNTNKKSGKVYIDDVRITK